MGPNMRHGQDTGGDRQRQRGVVDAQTRLRTHLAVTRVLAEAQSLPEAAPQVLEAICRRLGWELGALWMVDRRAQVLRCVDLWHVPATSLLGFTLATRHAVFREGEGLPGRVWAERSARWVPDVGARPGTLRSAPAAREGVRAALAFPIESRGEVLGVIEFFSAEARGARRRAWSTCSAASAARSDSSCCGARPSATCVPARRASRRS